MRRRILESAILEALWLGPLLGAPVALIDAMHRGGAVVPWLIVALAVLVGARRSLAQNLAPLLAVFGAAEGWALWVSSPTPRELTPSLAPILMTTAVAWIFVPALARSLEPRDTLEAHFPRTVLGDAAAILASVSFAVLFDLHATLGFVAALLSALLGQRAPAVRVRMGLAIIGGALLHVWLGLDAAIVVSAADASFAALELVPRAALAIAAVVVGVIVLARSEPRG
jgi:hypothetical protein